MCQVAKDTRTNLKLSRTQADIWSSWPGQNVALHLVTSVPASAISVGLFSQTQHFHIQVHHHCPGLRESSQPVSLQGNVVLSQDKDRHEKKRGNKHLCRKRSLRTNTQLTSDSKENTSKEILLAGVQKERTLGTEDLRSSCCRINFYLDPWSRSALMERVPSIEPKVHFLHLDHNYTREVELLIERSQFGVTVTESCSFALQAGSQTMRHGRFAAERVYFQGIQARRQENKPQINLAKGQGFVTYMG